MQRKTSTYHRNKCRGGVNVMLSAGVKSRERYICLNKKQHSAYQSVVITSKFC